MSICVVLYLRSWNYNDLVYIIISSPKSLDIDFHSCFSLFCVPGKFPESYSLLQHSMVNNLRGAKGQWKWPSILDTIVIQEFVALRRLEKKKSRKNTSTAAAHQKILERRKRSWKEPGLILFLSLLSAFFIILCIIENPKKSYQNGGGLWGDLRQIPSVSVQLCILCKYLLCCLLIYS